MVGCRSELRGEYSGEWIEWDPLTPLEFYERALSNNSGALLCFVERAILKWSFDDPIPSISLVTLRAMPWDLVAMAPGLYAAAFSTSDEEEADMMCRVFTNRGMVNIPELSKLSICERLHVPYARCYEDLPSGEILRLTKLLNIEAEIREQKGE